MITLKLKEIINFYDKKNNEISPQVSSITGVLGEDLAAGLIMHYFKNQMGLNCLVLNFKPTEGKKNGKWLDKWIIVSANGHKTFYQTEIKNWSAHSIGCKTIDPNASLEELQTFAYSEFKKQWDLEKKILIHKNVKKVMLKMKTKELTEYNPERDIIKPLICFWFPIFHSTDGEIKPFFELNYIDNQPFPTISFFSMSIYLRNLINNGVSEIEIDGGNVEKRMKLLNSLLEITSNS